MDNSEKILLKKKLKQIKNYKGEGTQLISLYLPPDSDRSSVTTQLTDEMSQSSNIKSQHTRKNVQAALKRIIHYLRQIDFKLPDNGLILFSGNVSENPAKTDVILLDLTPPKLLTSKLYWCDSSFHTDPLEELVASDQVYGIISVDKREATIAFLNGKSYRIVKHETSGVPGKTRAGGQSAHRFERLREKAAQDFFKRIGSLVNQVFVDEKRLKGMVVGGPGNTKNDFLKYANLDHRIKDKVLGKVDTCYTDESGIKEILDKSSDILKNAEIVKERDLVNKLIAEVSTNGLGTYGFLETIKSIKLGQADVVMVSEDLTWNVLKFKCTSCEEIVPKIVKNPEDTAKVEKETEKKCPYCGGKTELVEEADIFDFLLDFAKPMGSKVELISTETQEGNQFLNTFGGIAAILRYK